jgi:dGTPase
LARALKCNEDLTEAICLAHDLGHGPFGHSGEEALNELMEGQGGFDHNHQGLRIIEELEARFPNFKGLNLTWEVREGMLKHETDYDQAEVFAYDPHLRGTLEAQIVNLADEIAYTTADLDDGLRSGMIGASQLQDNALWNLVVDELGLSGQLSLSEMDRHRIIRRLVGKLVSNVIEHSYHSIAAQNIASVDDVRQAEQNLIGYTAEFHTMNKALKRFLFENLYRHWRVMRMSNKAKRIIHDLFREFVADPSMLPVQTQARLEHETLHRVICDYIAGMTDRFAQQEHERLFNPMAQV